MNGCIKTERGIRNLDLICRAQGEDEEDAMLALEAIIKENMGLVRSIALRFRDRGTDYEDLVQIGTIGMIKAVRSFSFEREVVARIVNETHIRKHVLYFHALVEAYATVNYVRDIFGEEALLHKSGNVG